MGVAEQFETFCKNLRMDTEVVANISYRYKRITKQINKDFWGSESETANSLLVGSYGRGTDIYVSDIDVLLKLPYSKYEQYNKYQGNGQSALLQEVKDSIEKTYKSYKRADGQVVKVDFSDGVSFEIVPGFINKDGISYTYPDTNNGGSWKTTNPRAEIDEFNSKNNEWNKNLKRLCRMARSWKHYWDVPIGGLLIDTLAYNFLKSWNYRNESYLYYDWMSRDFFEFLKNQSSDQNYWRAPGSGDFVYRKGKFEYKALQCYNISLEAIQKQKDGYESTAKKKWREIYGTRFPI
ncbi:nucleotidyltransferase [Paenibacillus alkaliterrae]|uniref:SMODS domain-containing nucleotidyltransferase n=1 Tax=Paenibacillus alkaliterrae TaxID=320909 RepID=UPI001F43249A|nr:nucleotidyltransferase [Paenibacillus alkaliterrae]MCF2941869.1 nucleotidyltransferase [Paenibacillus alkaliterrae]